MLAEQVAEEAGNVLRTLRRPQHRCSAVCSKAGREAQEAMGFPGKRSKSIGSSGKGPGEGAPRAWPLRKRISGCGGVVENVAEGE